MYSLLKTYFWRRRPFAISHFFPLALSTDLQGVAVQINNYEMGDPF